jgi:hypothetical protein
VLPVDYTGNVAGFGNENVGGREVWMADGGLVQFFAFGYDVRSNFQIVCQGVDLDLWVYLFVAVKFSVERLARKAWITELLEPESFSLTD